MKNNNNKKQRPISPELENLNRKNLRAELGRFLKEFFDKIKNFFTGKPQMPSISGNNMKMGDIPSFSLPSGWTCSKCACQTCYREGCYARKMEELRKNVRVAYRRNLLYASQHPQELEDWLNSYFGRFNSPRMFRLHVSGDFFDKAYLEMWLRIMRNHPDTLFMAFTKQKDVILPYLDEIPDNFSLIWSAWPGVPVPKEIRKKLPVAWMQDGTETRIPKNAIECNGDCEHCGRCWALNGSDVFFHKH